MGQSDNTFTFLSFYHKARDADARGDHEAVARNRRIALFCNIGGIASYAITIVIVIIIAVSISVAGANSGPYCSTYDGYYYYYYHCYYYK